MPTDPASSTCVNGDICIPPSANSGYGPGFIVQNCFRRLLCTLLLDKVMWKQWEHFLVKELMRTSRIKMGWDHITDGRLTFQLSSFQCTLLSMISYICACIHVLYVMTNYTQLQTLKFMHGIIILPTKPIIQLYLDLKWHLKFGNTNLQLIWKLADLWLTL